MSAIRRSLKLLPTMHRSCHVTKHRSCQETLKRSYHVTPHKKWSSIIHLPNKQSKNVASRPARELHCTANCHAGTTIPFKLSDIGEGIAEVTIKEWYVEVGDEVAQFDNICEVQSDKATVTITSRYDGIVRAIHFEVDDTCRVGQALVDVEVPEEEAENVLPTNSEPEKVLVPIETRGGVAGAAPSVSPAAVTAAVTPTAAVAPIAAMTPSQEKKEILTTPAVRKLAADKGIDLSLVLPTGKGGRITKEDLLSFIASPPVVVQIRHVRSDNPEEPMVANIPTAHIWNTSPTSQVGGSAHDDTTLQIKGIAKVMVKTMTAAQQVPRFTFHDEYCMDKIIHLKKFMKAVGQEHKTKLTFMPLLIKAASEALTDFPMINARVNGDCTAITYKSSHNIGIATDTPHGLMVPNIKNVQNLSILEIAKELSRLKSLSENNKLSTDDVTGGTFSLSNVGAVGGTYASPMLVVPEVCIGAFGKVQTRPAFDEEGQVFACNTMCVSWSGDHRVLDGATVARYSNTLKRFLEEPSLLLFYLK